MSLPARKVALKDATVKALKPAPKGTRLTVWDSLMPNMAVRVTDKGRRSFYVVKRRKGETKLTWHLLGQYPHMTLGEAREAAREAILTMEKGEDPKTLAEQKRQAALKAASEAAANTFKAIAEKFASEQLRKLRPSSQRIYEAYLRRELVPELGTRPITEIRRRDVLALIRKINEKSGSASAAGALAVLRRCLNWALGEDIDGFDSNPAGAVSAKDTIDKSEARDRTLEDHELRAVWIATATETVGAPFTTIYRLLLLTGLRLNEVAGAKWADLNLDAKTPTLTIPAERAKNKKEMLVPLPPLAVELFAKVPRFKGPFIFTTTDGSTPITSFSHAKARLGATLGDTVAPFVVHDFRRVVRSGLSRLKINTTVAELCLGHTRKGIEGVYDRHSYFDEKREALQRWQDHLLAIVEPPEPDDKAEQPNVVPLRARG